MTFLPPGGKVYGYSKAIVAINVYGYGKAIVATN